MKPFFLIPIILIHLGCSLENDVPDIQYVEIEATVKELNIGGYGNYFSVDWEVTNSSDNSISGWEIRVKASTPNSTIDNGFFFRYGIDLAPDEMNIYKDNVLFYQDTENIYPIILEATDTTLRSWSIVSIKGIVESRE